MWSSRPYVETSACIRGVFTSLTIAGAGADPTRSRPMFADGARRPRRVSSRAYDTRVREMPSRPCQWIYSCRTSPEGRCEMAFRLWLKISKIYVALSAASERINEAIKDHRRSHQRTDVRP